MKKTLNKSFYVLLLILIVGGMVAKPVLAQGSQPTDDDVNRIAKQLYCPVCESTPLDVCSTEACRQWRDLIRQMLSEGKTEDEIKQYFVEHYGVRVLDEPPNRWASYLVPVAAFLIGAFMLFRGFRMWLKPVEEGAGSTSGDDADAANAESSLQDDYIQKMEEELKKRN